MTVAYWHYDDGSPAPWGKWRFDPSHLTPLLVLLVVAGLLLLQKLVERP